MRNLPIKTKLICLVVFMCVVLTAEAWVGLSGMKNARASLESVYKDQLVAVVRLAAVGQSLFDARREMLVAVAFGRPGSGSTPPHHPLTEKDDRAARIEADLAEAEKSWREYLATILTAEEKLLAGKVHSSYTALVEQGIKPGIIMMRAGNIKGLDAHLRDVMLPLESRNSEALGALIRLQEGIAAEELARNASGYRGRFAASAIGFILAIAAAIVIGAVTARSVAGTAGRLRESERRYRTLFEQAAVGVAEVEPSSGRFLHVNKRYCDIVGLSMYEMLDTDFQSVTHPDDLEADLNNLKSLIAGEINEYSMDKRYVRKDGTIVWARLTVYPIWHSGEKPTRHISIVEDITKRKMAEAELGEYRLHLEDLVSQRTEELKAANQKLKELDRLKSMFIASMSHELRTPLNSIIGFTGMTLQGLSGELNDEQKDNLSRVYNSAKHLLSLITDVIDISKIEAGRIESYPEPVSLDRIVEDAIGTVRPQLNEKGLDLAVDLPPGEVRLNTDCKRLLQCLLNFLSNAVKYSETGTVAVAARETDGEVTISVSDTGIGIAEKDVPRVFEAFERLETHLRVKAGGTGLGLYLTRKIAKEILRGDVSFRSREGEGSTFTLTIPKDLQKAMGADTGNSKGADA